MQAGGPKAKVKTKESAKASQPVKSGLNLHKVAESIAEALESSRTGNIDAFINAARRIKEPENIADAMKELAKVLAERRFPSAAVRVAEFGSVAYAYHHDPAAAEEAIIMPVPKMKDGKEVLDTEGKPIMSEPSEKVIIGRMRKIRARIAEGEPGFTKKGNRETRTPEKLSALQFGRMLDYLKMMDKDQWTKYQDAYEAEAAVRREAKKWGRPPKGGFFFYVQA